MAACPIGGMKGVLIAARQTARGRPVGVHLPMGFYGLPICKMGVSLCLDFQWGTLVFTVLGCTVA